MLLSQVYPVERVSLSPAIAKKMDLWRLGLITMPEEYINFHKNLAELRLAFLQSNYGFRIVEKSMRSAGWFDGMRELNVIIETKSFKLRRLVWNDANQDFMLASELGGATVFAEEQLK